MRCAPDPTRSRSRSAAPTDRRVSAAWVAVSRPQPTTPAGGGVPRVDAPFGAMRIIDCELPSTIMMFGTPPAVLVKNSTSSALGGFSIESM